MTAEEPCCLVVCEKIGLGAGEGEAELVGLLPRVLPSLLGAVGQQHCLFLFLPPTPQHTPLPHTAQLLQVSELGAGTQTSPVCCGVAV